MIPQAHPELEGLGNPMLETLQQDEKEPLKDSEKKNKTPVKQEN